MQAGRQPASQCNFVPLCDGSCLLVYTEDKSKAAKEHTPVCACVSHNRCRCTSCIKHHPALHRHELELTLTSVAEHGDIAIRSNRLCLIFPDPRFCCSAMRGAPSLSATVKFNSKTLGLGSVMVSFLSKEYLSAFLSLGLWCLLPPKQAKGPP